MSTCKCCSEQFHTCSSCDLTGWEWYFCSDSCFKHYKIKRKEEICNKLDIDLELLEKIIEEIDFIY